MVQDNSHNIFEHLRTFMPVVMLQKDKINEAGNGAFVEENSSFLLPLLFSLKKVFFLKGKEQSRKLYHHEQRCGWVCERKREIELDICVGER